jgi:hypothetical protein
VRQIYSIRIDCVYDMINFSQSAQSESGKLGKLVQMQNMSKEENFNLYIQQRENDIERLKESMVKMDQEILSLSDQSKQIKAKRDNEPTKLQNLLQKQQEIFQNQANGLHKDRESLKSQLSNLVQGKFTKSIFIL